MPKRRMRMLTGSASMFAQVCRARICAPQAPIPAPACPADTQALLGARHANIEQPALLCHAGLLKQATLMRQQFLFQALAANASQRQCSGMVMSRYI